MMSQHNEHLQAIKDIRSMMEQSTRFISLSGLSGVFAGVCALIGAAMVYVYAGISPLDGQRYYYITDPYMTKWGMEPMTFFFVDAALVLLFAVAGGIFFTTRKAKQKGQKIWDKLTLRMLYNLGLPLAVGGIFCLGLIYHGLFGLVAPTTLVFYGLALINGSKFTLRDIHYLGILEVVLGLIAFFYIGYGLEVWAIGFGVLHIVYGIFMYYKYDS